MRASQADIRSIAFTQLTEQQLEDRLALASARVFATADLYKQLKKSFEKTNPLPEENEL